MPNLKLCVYIDTSKFIGAIKQLQILQFPVSDDVEVSNKIKKMAAQTEIQIRSLWSEMDRVDVQAEIATKQGEIDAAAAKMNSRSYDQLVTTDAPYIPPKNESTDDLAAMEIPEEEE